MPRLPLNPSSIRAGDTLPVPGPPVDLMNDSDPPTRDGRSCYPGCLAAALVLVLVPVGLGLGFLGWVDLTDSKDADERWWGVVALAGSTGMIVGGLLAILFVWKRYPAIWIVATVCLLAGVVADAWAAWVGVGLVTAAQTRGGDWGALAVATVRVFCVAVPISAAILTAMALACVGCVPRVPSAGSSLPRSRPG